MALDDVGSPADEVDSRWRRSGLEVVSISTTVSEHAEPRARPAPREDDLERTIVLIGVGRSSDLPDLPAVETGLRNGGLGG